MVWIVIQMFDQGNMNNIHIVSFNWSVKAVG
jgi:hypothetical protein